MSDEKHQPGPDSRLAEAGEHTILEGPEKHPPVPSVGAAGLGYALPPRADGMIYARPFLCTSVKSERQLVTGWVFIEPGDQRPSVVEGPGVVMLFVRDVKMGNPAEPDTVHWLADNYTGRSDGPGLTPVGSTEVTQDVSEGNLAPPHPAPVLTKKEQRQQDRGK